MKENERERKREGRVESNQFLSKPKTLDYTRPQRDHKGLVCTFIFSQSSNLGEEMNSRYHIYWGIFVCVCVFNHFQPLLDIYIT